MEPHQYHNNKKNTNSNKSISNIRRALLWFFVFCSRKPPQQHQLKRYDRLQFNFFLISSPGMIRGERLGSVLLLLKIIFQELAPFVFISPFFFFVLVIINDLINEEIL